MRSHAHDSPSRRVGYLVIDAETDVIILGAATRPFSISLDQAESFLIDGFSPRQHRRAAPD